MPDPLLLPIRELNPAQDLPGWLRLVHALEIENNGVAQTTEEQLRQGLAWPRTRRWVAEVPASPDTFAGYALLFSQIPERGQLYAAVHPQWRRRGLGSQMLALLLEEARKSGAGCAVVELDEKETAGIAFLRRRGFQTVGDTWVLRMAGGRKEEPSAPLWPEGYTCRSYAEVGDMPVLLEACNRSFGDMWGHHENTAGGVTEEDINGWMKSWDLNGVFLAFAPDGSPAGVCKAASAARTGEVEDYVDEPGIAPEHRHLRLQRPLVLTALRWLWQQGHRPVRLESWGDTPETVALYEDLGFKVEEHGLSLAYFFGEEVKGRVATGSRANADEHG